jgi:hypothetical protein
VSETIEIGAGATTEPRRGLHTRALERGRRWFAPQLKPRIADRRPWLVLGVALLCIGPAWLAAALSGNLVIPHNDAWAYSREAVTFARTGVIHLLNWGNMTLVGQLVMLGPLGRFLFAQQTAVAVLAVLFLYCSYELISPSVTTRAGLLAIAVLAVWPGFLSMATSFMTDVPSLAAMLAALLAGRVALQRDSRQWFVLALLLSFWAVSIREQAVAAPLAFLLYALPTSRRRERVDLKVLIVGAACLAVPALVMLHWRSGLAGANNPVVSFSLMPFIRDSWSVLKLCYFTLAIPLAPLALLTMRPRNWRLGSWLTAAVILAGGLYLNVSHLGYVLGNYINPGGEYQPVLPGGLRTVISGNWWSLLILLGPIGGAVMGATLVERWRAIDPVLGLFTIFSAAGLVGIGGMGLTTFDRYLLPLVPGVLAILLSPSVRSRATGDRPRWQALLLGAESTMRYAAAAATGCLVLVVSLALTSNAFSFDAARWNFGERFVKQGIATERVDAGLEWMGWHSANGIQVMAAPQPWNFGWQAPFTNEPSCIVINSSPLQPANPTQAKWKLAGVYTYRSYLLVGTSHLYAYSSSQPGCHRTHA